MIHRFVFGLIGANFVFRRDPKPMAPVAAVFMAAGLAHLVRIFVQLISSAEGAEAYDSRTDVERNDGFDLAGNYPCAVWPTPVGHNLHGRGLPANSEIIEPDRK